MSKSKSSFHKLKGEEEKWQPLQEDSAPRLQIPSQSFRLLDIEMNLLLEHLPTNVLNF